MYEQLSHGVSFYSGEQIAQEQLFVAATAWARHEIPSYDFNAAKVTSGRLNDWQDRLIVTTTMTYPLEMVEAVRSVRDRVHEGVVEQFERCRSTPELSYDYWFEREQNSVGKALIAAYQASQKGKLSSAPGIDRIRVIQGAFRNRGWSGSEMVGRFWRS